MNTWNRVDDLLPGYSVKECLIELKNGEHHIVSAESVRKGGIWLAKDGKTETVIVAWTEIKRGVYP